jgi:tRNA dimethylallyltransferase
VPHHLLDVLDVTETASVAAYQRDARAVMERLPVPVLAGGSGLYVRAVLEHFEFPGTDPDLRARLEAELALVGPEPLHARLAAQAPRTAANILPSNGRRIVRALEVLELTGEPLTARLPDPRPYYSAVHVGVDVDSSVLDERIAVRVDLMFQHGLVDEVRTLERRGLREGRTAGRALGYQQVLAYLSGECSEEQAREETVRATRRFVRRQRSWFRRDPRIAWLDGGAPDLATRALALAPRAR